MSHWSGQPYEVVRFAIKAAQVTRLPGLVVHPSVETNGQGEDWGVSAACGLSLGRFRTRAAAENYAAAIAKAHDWTSVPDDITGASKWATECPPALREAFREALRHARSIDKEPFMPLEND